MTLIRTQLLSIWTSQYHFLTNYDFIKDMTRKDTGGIPPRVVFTQMTLVLGSGFCVGQRQCAAQ